MRDIVTALPKPDTRCTGHKMYPTQSVDVPVE
jgi:hypothetical protein